MVLSVLRQRDLIVSELSNRIVFDLGAVTYFLARLNASVRSRAYTMTCDEHETRQGTHVGVKGR